MSVESLLDDFRTRAASAGMAVAYAGLQSALGNVTLTAGDWLLLGEGLMRAGVPGIAATVAEQGLDLHVHDHALRVLLGNALRMVGERAAAERELRAVLAAEPVHRQAAVSLAHLLRESGRHQAAGEAMLLAWRDEAPLRDDALATIAFLRECGLAARAFEVAAKALKAHPGDAPLHARMGELALELGRFEQARAHLRASLDVDAAQPGLWVRLATAHRFQRRDEGDAMRIAAFAARRGTTDMAGIAAHFALGKIESDLGDLAAAVRTLRAGNAALRARLGWSRAGWQAFVDRQCRLPSPEPAATPPERGFVPVLIVGLPRSGTTLAATLLARHPAVRGRGELNWLAQLATHIDGAGRTSTALNHAAALYAAQLRGDDGPARCYIDKNPLNFRHLGHAVALLPGLRVIHCRRDLRDTALSLWQQMFAHEDNTYAYDFADIAAYAAGYRQLMDHWHEVLEVPQFELDYEALVADSEATLARLHAFLGLEPDASGTAPPQSIRTASAWQARQTIHAASIGRWRAWAPHLPELEAAISAP